MREHKLVIIFLNMCIVFHIVIAPFRIDKFEHYHSVQCYSDYLYLSFFLKVFHLQSGIKYNYCHHALFDFIYYKFWLVLIISSLHCAYVLS